jgi:hypothetical protein
MTLSPVAQLPVLETSVLHHSEPVLTNRRTYPLLSSNFLTFTPLIE